MRETHSNQLKAQLHPSINQLAEIIVSAWQNNLDLSPYHVPEELGYIEGRLEGEKLTIENLCYQSREFRKMHLELAKVGTSLDILHCVMFPRLEYSLPMFGCDIVAGKGQISAAIVDLSPLNSEKILPTDYQQALTTLPELEFSQMRDLPEWGDIFSEFVLFIRPSNSEEMDKFINRVADFLKIHTSLARNSESVSQEEKAANLAAHQYYCHKQRKNDKTRRVLEKAFGEDWAEKYLNNILFDLPA